VLLVAALGLCSCLPGCSVWHLAHRTLYSELSQYPQVTDGKLACRQYRRWAKDEWQRISHQPGSHGYSSDYASGFIQGFVDQVYAGGNAQAPPIPPRKYWRIGYRNPRGRRAVEQWYDGFRHGAQVAKEGGYREEAVIPSSLWGTQQRADDEQDVERRTGEEEGPPPEPTPAEVLQSPTQVEPLPTPVTRAPLPDPLEETARALEAGDDDMEDATLPVGQPTLLEPDEEQTPLPFPDDEGPPPPPWHRSADARGSTAAASFTKHSSGDQQFDPFEGTAFQPALGLAPPRSTREPIPADGPPDSANKEPSAELSADEDPQAQPVHESDGAGAKGWQQVAPPASSWKKRN
jgi:hypothetical protein